MRHLLLWQGTVTSGNCSFHQTSRRSLQSQVQLRLGVLERFRIRRHLQEGHFCTYLWQDQIRQDSKGTLVIPRMDRCRQGSQSSRGDEREEGHLWRLSQLPSHVPLRIRLLLPTPTYARL